jgi:hypothetical protein
MMSRILALVLALSTVACTPSETTTAGAVQERPALLAAPDTRTVLVGEQAMRLTHQCSRISPGPVEGEWTPTRAQLDALDNALADFLAHRLEEAGSQASPGDYYRQTMGFVIGGRRVVYVNGVERSAVEREPDPAHPFDWRTHAIGICDGGPITFGVEYDPETGAFSHFAFNGSVG